MNAPVISTKADTLLSIKNVVTKSYIEDIEIISVREFISFPSRVTGRIYAAFDGDRIVVRSSSKNEDCMTSSNAGHYESILDVDSNDKNEVINAIEKVINSYLEEGQTYSDIMDEQVLIQRMTEDVSISGVIFTRDIIYNRPYYLVSYDDNGTTDSVTSGESGKTRWISKNVGREFLSIQFEMLITAVKEIEGIYNDVPALDIEFAITKSDKVVIFQVRPLAAVADKIPPMTDADFVNTKAFSKCNYLDTNHIMSDMAYWNPAEMIGTNPRPLDYSLYRNLITEKIWSSGIAPLGYEPVDAELMYKIGNKPYISINYSFQGLTPARLPKELKNKLYYYYENKLKMDKTAHDKIEFEIILNTFDFTTEDRINELKNYGFDDEEREQIRKSLYGLTSNIVKNYKVLNSEDLDELDRLTELRRSIRASSPTDESNTMKLYKFINELLISIKEHGTPLFTRQARFAFMARSFCRTLVEKSYFTQDEMDNFLMSIPTVASEFERDFDRYSHGEIDREEFNKAYGHLRIGTYDIRTDCYAKMYFDVNTAGLSGNNKKQREAVMLDENRLKRALDDIGFNVTPESFIDFIVQATKNREYFKFEFTKSLSLMLEIIIHLGEELKIAREDMSYLEINDLLSYHSRESYVQIINSRRNMYHCYSYLILPEIIFDVGDIDVIDLDEARPNFITDKVVTADIVNLDKKEVKDISGKIVVVTKADPGYDWIFSKKIAGFVTKYGGAASHMAIRCAEFGIPAAIGCGEKIYQKVVAMDRMELNCVSGMIIER